MSSGPTKKSFSPRAFSGWALEAAATLDQQSPHFLLHLLSASALKRQAVFAALAARLREGPAYLADRLLELNPSNHSAPYASDEQIARTLMAASSAREIVSAVFGEVPNGLIGVLARLGDDPLPEPALYDSLFNLFRCRENRFRANALMQCSGSLDATKIEIVQRLDSVLVHPNVLRRLYSATQALDANAALALVRNTVSCATDDSIRQSIANLGDKTDLAKLFRRWLAKMDRPPARPPIPEDDPDLTVMMTGEALSSLGIRYRNCSATRVAYLALGSEILVEWRHTPGAIGQCQRLTNGGWVLIEVHAKGNGRVEPATAIALRRKLQDLGIPALSSGDAEFRRSGVLSLLGAWGGVGNNLGFDDEEQELAAGMYAA